MDINKDTTVKLVGPFESSIKLEALVKILNEFLGKEYDLDELIDDLNDWGEESVFIDGYVFFPRDPIASKNAFSDKYGLTFEPYNSDSNYANLPLLLEKVFEEPFYGMLYRPFNIRVKNDKTIKKEEKALLDIYFNEYTIWSGDLHDDDRDNILFEFITKSPLGTNKEIDITEDEKILLADIRRIIWDTPYGIDKNFEWDYNSSNDVYHYIRKKNFNKKNKWHSGWYDLP